MPDRALFLCGTPRTASTRLCSLLSSTGVAGRPESYFRAPDRRTWARTLGVTAGQGGEVDQRAFLTAVLQAGRTPGGVFAARVMWGSMEPLVDSLRRPGERRTGRDLLAEAFGAPVFVHVVRPDTVAQAVSWARAEQTGHWQDGDRTSREPVFDLAQIDGLVRTIAAHDAAWRSWFEAEGVEPLTVTYDDVVDEPAGVVERILDALGVPVPVTWRPTSTTTRQADHVNADWVRRYRSSRVSGAPA